VTPPSAIRRTEELFKSLGRHCERVGDGPGLVLGRIVCQLVNEAAFLIGEGNGTPDDVDAGMELGVNHPRGPVAWSEAVGLEHVVSVLDALHRELGEERYRVAPLLRQRLALGAGLR
jgi:3-hydroxybutyryl-CoA dehydrogenase